METEVDPLEVRCARFARRAGRPALVMIALAALVGGGYYAWQAWGASNNSRGEFVTATAERGDLEEAVTATGTLQPRGYVDVGTQVSGQLKKLYPEVGATVKAGDLLAEIDPTVYRARVDANRAQLRNQRAQLADRQAQLVLAEQQLARQQNLAREDATTTDALQTAEAQLQSARAQVDALKAQIDQTQSTLRGDEANLGYTKIYAPMAGTVVSQTAKQGQTLNANQQAPIVLRIADLSTMTVEAQVSEADVSKLTVGMDVYFTTLGNQERRWRGQLRQIVPTPQVVNNVVLYSALFDVPNPNQELMTQMTAQVFFVLASAKDAIFVPISALRPVASEGRRGKSRGDGADERPVADPRGAFTGGKASVRVMKSDGEIERREVKVGATNRVSAQVLEGLEVGERVVIGAATPVNTQRPTTGAAPGQFRTPRI
jgi:macrolide-specific efflux system membrane fusion protein